MTTKFYVGSVESCGVRDSYEEAEKEAKIDASSNGNDQYIYQAIAVARSPIPEIVVEKL